MIAQGHGLIAEDLGDELARTDCGAVGLGDDHDLLDLIGRNAGADRTVPCKGRGGGDHRIDAVVRILHRAKLSLEENRLPLPDGLIEVQGGVAKVFCNLVAALLDPLEKSLPVDRIGVIEVDKQCVLDVRDAVDLLHQGVIVLIELVDLPADLCELVGIERRNAALGRAERLAGKTCFLERIEQHVIGHHDLHAVRDHQLRRRNALGLDVGQLLQELVDIKGDAVADDVHDVLVKHTRGHQVKCKLAVLIDDRMARV